MENSLPQHTYQLKHLSKKDFVAELYNRYGKKLYGYAIRNWHMEEDEAWNLIYKTLYKVLDSYKNYTFANEEKFASYVFKIFINYLRNHYRDHKKDEVVLNSQQIDLSTLQDKPDQPEQDLLQNPKLTALNAVLDTMEDWQKILLLMRSNGSSYADIAQYVNKPEDQLKVYYQRLKKQLTEKLNERI